jgi:hypothetical protein
LDRPQLIGPSPSHADQLKETVHDVNFDQAEEAFPSIAHATAYPILGCEREAMSWTCQFRARAGPQARATFATADQARRFAERHAGDGAAPFDWSELGDASMLVTASGTYNVTNGARPIPSGAMT